MNKVIKIRIENPAFLKITYTMTKSCTYKCRYCPDDLHEGKHTDVDLNRISTFIDKFSDRQVIFNITGGESTTHPQFKDLLLLLRQKNIKTIVDTNCVRSIRFYEEHGSLVDNWYVSLHPSQHTLNLDKIKILSKLSFVVVNVLMDPMHWDISLDWLNQLKTIDNIKINSMKIISDWAGARCSVTYTPEQEDMLRELRPIFNFTKEKLEELNNSHSWLKDMVSIGTREDNTEFIVDYSDMIKNKENIFTGWKCWAGNHAIQVDSDLTVNWANCGVKSYGDISKVTSNEISKELICNRKSCDCGTDIKSPKEINV